MAARIEVIEGPDAGWKFTVVGGEARIGCGAGYQVRLTDPSWPGGDIRVQLRHGGYLVTNGLAYAVYLDGSPLPPSESRNLHHGATLQPTQTTLLRLEIVAAPAGTAGEGGVIAESPKSEKPGTPLWKRAVPAAIIVAGALFLLLAPGSAAGPDLEVANRHKAALEAVETELPREPQVRAVRVALGEAAYAETFRKREVARQKYRDARDRLAKLLRPGEDKAPALTPDQADKLTAAQEFVNQRLRATARR